MARLCDVTLPVSLHVLDAGDGGGGISKRSAVSLLLPAGFDADAVDVPAVTVDAPDDELAAFTKSFKSLDVKLLAAVELLLADV